MESVRMVLTHSISIGLAAFWTEALASVALILAPSLRCEETFIPRAGQNTTLVQKRRLRKWGEPENSFLLDHAPRLTRERGWHNVLDKVEIESGNPGSLAS